jgi:hypothetical protein
MKRVNLLNVIFLITKLRYFVNYMNTISVENAEQINNDINTVSSWIKFKTDLTDELIEISSDVEDVIIRLNEYYKVLRSEYNVEIDTNKDLIQ